MWCSSPALDVSFNSKLPGTRCGVLRRPLVSIRRRTSAGPELSLRGRGLRSPRWAESARPSPLVPVRAAAVGPRARARPGPRAAGGAERSRAEPDRRRRRSRARTAGAQGRRRSRAARGGAGRRPAQPWRTRARGRAASRVSWAAPTASPSPRRWPVALPSPGARAAPGSWSSRTSEVGALR